MFGLFLFCFAPLDAIPPDSMSGAISRPMASVASPVAHSAEVIGSLDARFESPLSAVTDVENVASALVVRDGVPPSPAILNAAGFHAVVSIVFGSNDPSPVTPEIADILEKWEDATLEIRTLKLEFVRTTYESTIKVERVANVEAVIQAPDTISVISRGSDAGRIQRRAGFWLESERAHSLVCSPSQILAVDDLGKTYERLSDSDALDDKISWPRIMTARMQLLLFSSIRADQVRRAFSLQLAKRTNDAVVIAAKPRSWMFRSAAEECWIMLDTKTWLPVAIKYFDTARQLETVYRVTDRRVNIALPERCFDPDLDARGYTCVTPRKAGKAKGR